MAETAVRLSEITKRFPGVVANDQIELEVETAEIHAVVGENGAGKSTLMKILYGMYPPDEGTIEVEGKPARFTTPKDAIDAGIGMVHQHFMLADQLTVLENVILGSSPTRPVNPVIAGLAVFVAVAVATGALVVDALEPARWPILAAAFCTLAVGIPRLGWVALGAVLSLFFVRIAFAAGNEPFLFFTGSLSGGIWPLFLLLLAAATLAISIVMAVRASSRPVISFRAAREAIERLSGAHGVGLDPDALIEDLSVGEKQRVEIVKVLYRGARILILDEPTAVLVPQEVEQLFGDLRGLKGEGVTIIFISHKLDEVLEIADTITVVRDGRTVAAVKPDEVTASQLAELMVGSELPTPETAESTVTDELVVEVTGLGVRGEGERWLVKDADFAIHRGEILGIAGVEGNGQQALTDLMLGIRSADAGSIVFGGRSITQWSTRARREAGIGLIPAERQGQGLLLPSPLWENVILGHQTVEPFERYQFIDRKNARQRTAEVVEEYDVRTPGVDVLAEALSGGNQQKLIVGREMASKPDLLIAAHPTRGIDVGAQAAVWEQLREARKAGLAVLLISADLEELLGLSDVLKVILRGELVATLDPATVTAEELGSYMTGAAVQA